MPVTKAFIRNTMGFQLRQANMKPSNGIFHEIPLDLVNALEEHKVLELWEALTPIGRNEFICWVEDAKQAKTREKRINRTVEELKEGKKRPCCWPGCIHRTDKKPGKWQLDVLIAKKQKP